MTGGRGSGQRPRPFVVSTPADKERCRQGVNPDGTGRELGMRSVDQKPDRSVCGVCHDPIPESGSWTFDHDVPTCSESCAAYFAFLVLEDLLVPYDVAD